MLSTILKDNRNYSAEYGPHLSNHLSMASLALSGIGGSEREIETFATYYREKHALIRLKHDDTRLSAASWTKYLGDRQKEFSAIEYFRRAIESEGRDKVLRAHLPVLLRGIGAGAFHPLIRTAYALDSDDDAELAVGLGYWLVSYLDLGVSRGTGTTDDLNALLSAFRTSPTRKALASTGPIHERMAEAAAQPGFQSAVSALRTSTSTLPSFAGLALTIFLQTLDFTALHLVTGTHAFRLIQPWVTDTETANGFFWRAILGAYASMGAPPIDLSAASTGIASVGLDELHAIAKSSLDDHVIKIIYTATREQEHYGNDLYINAAASYAKKIEANGNS